MCRVATAEFDPLLPSVAQARRWVTERLVRWELGGMVDTVVLLTSELVTNAIVHAASRPVVVLAVADGEVEVGVTDSEDRPADRPRPRPDELSGADEATFMAEGGRGLVLVDALADEWGTARLADGKQVWFRMRAPDWAYRHECACTREDLDRVRLESGRAALALPGPWDHAA